MKGNKLIIRKRMLHNLSPFVTTFCVFYFMELIAFCGSYHYNIASSITLLANRIKLPDKIVHWGTYTYCCYISGLAFQWNTNSFLFNINSFPAHVRINSIRRCSSIANGWLRCFYLETVQ